MSAVPVMARIGTITKLPAINVVAELIPRVKLAVDCPVLVFMRVAIIDLPHLSFLGSGATTYLF